MKGSVLCSVSDPGHCGADPDADLDPCLWQVELDPALAPDPAIFIIALQGTNKKPIITFWLYIYIIFQKVIKKSKQ